MAMEPPPKRPRLSILSNNPPPDAALNQARYRNDLSLKARFEAIFAKYSHDFSGIGDEIEIISGKVVVDNGHLQSMQDERDTGALHPVSQSQRITSGNVSGLSLLRAMTEAPEDEVPSFENVRDDDVIMSIEAMAENAGAYAEEDDGSAAEGDPHTEAEIERDLSDRGSVTSDDALAWEEENEPFNGRKAIVCKELNSGPKPATLSASRRAPSTASGDCSTDLRDAHQRPEESSDDYEEDDMDIKQEEDSDLWADPTSSSEKVVDDRWSSPDSLFDNELDRSNVLGAGRGNQELQANISSEFAQAQRELSNEAILNKFGPEIGQQVLEVLQKHREMLDAHIEPAWRIPDHGVVFQPTSIGIPVDNSVPQKTSPENTLSVWRDRDLMRRGLKVRRRPVAIRMQDSSAVSEDSFDPLQEPDPEKTPAEEIRESDMHEVWLEEIEEGICPFCQKQFSVKGTVFSHWDELIKKSAEDGIHDMDYIRDQRSRKRRRSLFPRVTVGDLCQMVKLHEVDKMEWREMEEHGYFPGRPASSLQSLYYQYRTVAKTDEQLAAEGRSWTKLEDEKLIKLCQNRSMTISRLRRSLRTRPQAEIGNRLATIWMQEYVDMGFQLVDPKIKRNLYFKTLERSKSASQDVSLRRSGSLELANPNPNRSASSGLPADAKDIETEVKNVTDDLFI